MCPSPRRSALGLSSLILSDSSTNNRLLSDSTHPSCPPTLRPRSHRAPRPSCPRLNEHLH
ncbi:hypothetical protein K438DRAFT_1878802 [Mycena galopus ATCC 62051]|nr:hypothetical protein K438DRAFT_1878802 [Mycena galopus ATCC 62051]